MAETFLEAHEPPRPRRLTFRLPTLFLVTGAVALLCWLYLVVTAAYRCRESASNELRRHGAFVAGDLHTVGIGGPWATDAELAKLGGIMLRCGGPEELDLTDSRVTDLRIIGNMERIEWLYLDGSAVSDDSIPPLVKLRRLRCLGLFNTNLTDACIPSLCAMAQLQDVRLTGTKVTSQGVDRLRTSIPGIDVTWSEGKEDRNGTGLNRGMEDLPSHDLD